MHTEIVSFGPTFIYYSNNAITIVTLLYRDDQINQYAPL